MILVFSIFYKERVHGKPYEIVQKNCTTVLKASTLSNTSVLTATTPTHASVLFNDLNTLLLL